MSKPTPSRANTSFAIPLCIVLASLAGSTAFSQTNGRSISSLKFIGEYELPHGQIFKNTVVGGFSGIDFDQASDQYYLICDDRSEMNVARFYTAYIPFSEKGIDTVVLTGFKPLLDPDSKPYPGIRENRRRTPDPESIRYNRISHELVWSSEGERELGKDTVLINPAILVMGTDGHYRSAYQLPPALTMQATETGPRQNGALESLAFSDDFTSLYTCLEEPLYQDGPRAATEETKSWARIYQFDVQRQINTAQYAYKLEKVAYPALPAGAFKVNGVTEMLYAGAGKLLTVERSFSTGSFAFVIKVFLADLSKAGNVAGDASLIQTPPRYPAVKKLLLDMSTLGIVIDNIEGVTFGPLLPNGHQTLLFVADNNFKPYEKNQFLLFEVIP